MAAGSTSPCSSRSGSTPPATIGAAISSPSARTTPLTAPPAERDRDDLGAGRAARPRRPGRRRRAPSVTAPGPALGEDGLARGPAVVAGRVGQQDGGRAGRPGPHGGEQDAARGQRGPHGLVREALPDEVGDRHRERPQQVAAVVAPEAAVARARAGAPPARRRADGALDVGRRGRGRGRPRKPASARTRRSNSRYAVGVGRRPRAQLRGRPRGIGPQGHRAAVRLRREDRAPPGCTSVRPWPFRPSSR